MVAELKMQAEQMTRASIIERVQACIEAGQTPNQAFAAVWEQIERAGELETLARLHGSSLVGMLWRSWNIEHRPAAMSRTIARPVSPTLITATAIQRPMTPSAAPTPRVVNLDVVRETLDSKYKIDGSWIRLGDMDSAACLKVAEQYRSSAIANEHKSRHMRAIAAKLKEGQTVQDALTESELMRLFKITEPAGNTLA